VCLGHLGTVRLARPSNLSEEAGDISQSGPIFSTLSMRRWIMIQTLMEPDARVHQGRSRCVNAKCLLFDKPPLWKTAVADVCVSGTADRRRRSASVLFRNFLARKTSNATGLALDAPSDGEDCLFCVFDDLESKTKLRRAPDCARHRRWYTRTNCSQVNTLKLGFDCFAHATK